MTTDPTSPSPPRRFGLLALALATLAAAIVAAGGTWLLGRRSADHDHAAEGEATAKEAKEQKEQWQCPMHPSIVQDHPGDCPICGMKLVKIEAAAPAAVASPEGLAPVTIDAARQQLIGLKIAHAERGPVGGSWRTTGRVAIDETRVHHVNVKFSGFMEHVHGDFVGRPVRKGDPLFTIYSPELLAAQEEYLLALRTRKTLAEQGGMTADGDALVAASRRKLELWDVPRSELDRIARSGEPSRTITFYSPATGVLTKKDVVPGMRVNAGDMPFEIVNLARVWVLADAYESDLGQVRVGMSASLTLKAFQGRTFQGRVAFVDPLLDPKTRTAKVRIEFPNPGGDLRPEMFGEVVLQGRSRVGLRVPTDALIQSGTQSVVFVALPGGKFLPREVEVGGNDGQFTEVLEGLEEGDGVVTRANFLVDSESRLRASLAALAGGGGAAKPAGGTGTAAGADPHAGHGK